MPTQARRRWAGVVVRVCEAIPACWAAVDSPVLLPSEVQRPLGYLRTSPSVIPGITLHWVKALPTNLSLSFMGMRWSTVGQAKEEEEEACRSRSFHSVASCL